LAPICLLGTDLLGEEDALLDGLGGEVRPVGRDQDVLPIRRPDWHYRLVLPNRGRTRPRRG
jgi:hypothetical protein